MADPCITFRPMIINNVLVLKVDKSGENSPKYFPIVPSEYKSVASDLRDLANKLEHLDEKAEEN
jgi:hypothetical protein